MWAAAIPAGIGLMQAFGAGRELNKLQRQPQAMLAETAEMRASRLRADALAKRGFTPEETSAFMNNQASLANQRYRTATTTAGGNLAGAISAGVSYGNIKSLLDFASADAGQKRNNIRYADSFSRETQRIADANIQRQQYLRDRTEASLGSAVQSGINNIATGAMMAAMYGGDGNKANTTGTTTGGGTTTQFTGSATAKPMFNPSAGLPKGALGKFMQKNATDARVDTMDTRINAGITPSGFDINQYQKGDFGNFLMNNLELGQGSGPINPNYGTAIPYK